MRLHYAAILFLCLPLAVAQTIHGATTTMTKTELHTVRLTGSSAIYSVPRPDLPPNFVFMTTDLPDPQRSLVQTNLAAPLTTAQAILVKAVNGHLAVAIRCESFGLLTIKNATTGKVHQTGTGDKCAIEFIH